ncbi:N-6 DNA methylase [Longitalea arenae]|uniref:N-6 DNA methylase n=1 Tax=Longitalea arenae TaxID=2812558 RepID=UPI0019671A71|nr:N-6 DNA methylase [Longitalea arenae]
MKLHEAIEDILLKSGKPLTVRDIVFEINNTGLYKRKDEKKLEANQVRARIRQYSELFQNINGHVFITSDTHWKDLLTSYWHSANTLRGILPVSELQFIIACIFYFKRIENLKTRNKEYGKRYFAMQHMGMQSFRNIPGIENSKLDYTHILAEYSRIISKAKWNKETEIHLLTQHVNTEQYSDEVFGHIFEYLLHLNSLDSNKSPITYTPNSLRELMIGLLDPEKGKTIFDPVSGTGGLLVEAQNYAQNTLKVTSYEVNYRVALLNLMNQEMHGYFDVEIKAMNCFDDLNDARRFDYIIGDLPIDGVAGSKEYLDLSRMWGVELSTSGKGFNAILLYVLSKLNQNGKAVLTVSESFLFKKGKELAVRKLLVGNDLIESVIGLPYGSLRPNTEAKAAILVLNANKSIKNKIKFIRAQAISSDKQGLDLNTEEILQFHAQPVEDRDLLQVVDTRYLLKDFNLSAYAYDAAYFLTKEMLDEGSGKLLGDLVQIHSGTGVEKKGIANDGDIPYVKIENLSTEILNIYLTKEQITSKVHYESKLSRSLITEECILVARIGDNLKPTYFKPNDLIKSILIHGGVYSITPKDNAINLEYLYYQLHSAYIKDQLKRIRLGAVMPYVSISGLKQLLIPYVDLRSQEDFVRTQKANIIASERLKIEEKIKLLGYKEEKVQAESDIVRTLVHQLRPTLLNIDLEVKKVKRIVEENNLSKYKENIVGNEKDEEIAHLINDAKDYSLAEIVEKLQHDTLQLNDVLTTVNKVMSFKLTTKDMEDVDLLEFISDYLGLKKIDINGRFEIEVRGEHFISMVSKASFRDMLDQLLINAEKHAFRDFNPHTRHKVSFAIKQSKERGIAIIDYQNNGKPFKLSYKDFITPFVKSQGSNGSGIGGNYIYRIIQAHNGEIAVKEGLKTGFALTIEIPLNQKQENE